MVATLEPNNVLHQGLGATGTFTLIDKAGGYLITGAHTVPDTSLYDGAPTVPQYLARPDRQPLSGPLPSSAREPLQGRSRSERRKPADVLDLWHRAVQLCTHAHAGGRRNGPRDRVQHGSGHPLE